MYRILLAIVCIAIALGGSSCANRGQILIDAEAGFEQERGFFASRTPLSPQAAENLRVHVISAREELDPISIGEEKTYLMLNTDILDPEMLQGFFPAAALLPVEPDTSRYAKLGWFDINIGNGSSLGGEFASALTATNLVPRSSQLHGDAGVVWMTLDVEASDSLQEIVDRMIAVAAEYGGDAIINVSLARKVFIGGEILKSDNYTLAGDVIRFR